MLYYVDLRYACFGIEVIDGIVKEAPPLASWMEGKSLATVTEWVQRQRGVIKKLGK